MNSDVFNKTRRSIFLQQNVVPGIIQILNALHEAKIFIIIFQNTMEAMCLSNKKQWF
jgi:hypothetical protein